MPKVVINERPVEVAEGTTILDAARALGVDIPTLCFLDGYEAATSCMICLVKVKDPDRLVPSCATVVEDGMHIETDTEEIHDVRRTGLELLLSDHLGDCTAPCSDTCPAGMNIPLMLRQVETGDLRGAIATIKKDIALPAVLGRVCPDLCERTCRRGILDSPVSICLIKRHVADVDLADNSPYLPDCKSSTGRRVAVVGAGAAGITAAFHLQQAGHACTLFEQDGRAGGKLLRKFTRDQLPREVIQAECALVEKLGVCFALSTRIDTAAALADLRERFDAVLVTIGAVTEPEPLGLPGAEDRLQVNAKTHETPLPGVFAAGDAMHPSDLVVRCVASGKTAAACIDQYLCGIDIVRPPRPFSVHIGRLQEEELQQLRGGASASDRILPAAGDLSAREARSEAQRCLHCECSQEGHCKLQQYAQQYGARASRYPSKRRSLERHFQHADIVFEPGKCILCGLCIQIAARAREPLGLTFIGRGFDMQVGVPLDGSLAEALKVTARQCAEACPTGALRLRY